MEAIKQIAGSPVHMLISVVKGAEIKNSPAKRHSAVALAEVIIVLAIIGIVAVLTIPTLITTNQTKAWNTGATVFERRLEEALKVMNTQGTLAGYKSTSAFVNELSRHLKIVKVCNNNDLTSCFAEKVMFGVGEAEPEEVEIKTIKTAKNFGQNDWNTEVVGFQLNNGTNGLIAYNPDCKQDPFSNQVTGTGCVAVLYDTSGFSKPNTSGKDLRSINISKLGNVCAFELNGSCYGTPFLVDTPHIWNNCQSDGTSKDAEDIAFMNKYGIQYCMLPNYGKVDYWAGAVEICGGVDKMPTMDLLAQIATDIYGQPVFPYGSTINANRDNAKMSSLGLSVDDNKTLLIVSGNESSGHAVYFMWFAPTYVKNSGNARNGTERTFCKID